MLIRMSADLDDLRECFRLVRNAERSANDLRLAILTALLLTAALGVIRGVMLW